MVLSDISQRTAAYADKRLLKRSVTNNILGQFGQMRTIPKGSSKSVKFRRYEPLAVATTPLTEGVTPSGSIRNFTDYVATLQQYGDFVRTTDQIRDTHEDPILQDNSDTLGEQAAQTYDQLKAGVLVSGTQVLYSNGASRAAVNTPIDLSDLKRAERYLGRQEGKKLKSIIHAGPNIGTNPIRAAYICVVHIDLKYDLEAITGWKDVAEYPQGMGLIEGEIGSAGAFRFVVDNNLSPTILGSAWTDAGGVGATMIATTNAAANVDVYAVLCFAKDAYGNVGLGGMGSVQTYVSNPKASDSDPLAQRGTQGWKGYHAIVILQELWMIRIECACTA